MQKTESNFQFDLQLFAEDDEIESMSDEDIEALVDEDPDLALALEDDDEDEENDVELDEDDELATKRKKKARTAAPAIDAETQRIIDDIKTNPDKYTREPARPAIDNPIRREEPVKEPVLDVAAIAKAFSADLVSDPEKAGARLIATMLQMQKQSEDRVRRDTRAEYDGLSSQTANQTVRAAMAEFDNHPAMNPEVKKEFKTLVAKAVERAGTQIAKMKPEDVSAGLRSAFAEAIGNVAMNTSTTRQRKPAAAPVYAPRHGSGARPSGRATPQLSAEERDVIRNMREAGITDAKVLKQTIRELRAEAVS